MKLLHNLILKMLLLSYSIKPIQQTGQLILTSNANFNYNIHYSSSRTMIKMFYVSSQLFTVLEYFGDLNEEVIMIIIIMYYY